MPIESDATRGSASQSLAERAVSVVETRTRNRSPPICEKSSVCITLEGLHVRNADTRPSQAIDMAIRNGKLVELVPAERERTHLGLPDPAVFRAAFENPTGEQVRAKYLEECEGRGRPEYVGALYELVEELADE